MTTEKTCLSLSLTARAVKELQSLSLIMGMSIDEVVERLVGNLRPKKEDEIEFLLIGLTAHVLRYTPDSRAQEALDRVGSLLSACATSPFPKQSLDLLTFTV